MLEAPVEWVVTRKPQRTQSLWNLVETCRQFLPIPEDGQPHVDLHGGPDLGLHGVLAGPGETPDPQMLHDLFEEQLHLPAAPVARADNRCRQDRVVGKEREPLFPRSGPGCRCEEGRPDMPWRIPGW